jgi:hypothetical protein
MLLYEEKKSFKEMFATLGHANIGYFIVYYSSFSKRPNLFARKVLRAQSEEGYLH